MARRRRTKDYSNRLLEADNNWTVNPETKKAIAIVFIFLLAFLGILSMFDLAGTFGSVLRMALGYAFGWGDWIFLLILLALGYILLNSDRYQVRFTNYLGLLLFIIGYSGIFNFFVTRLNYDEIVDLATGGGALGFLIGQLTNQFLGFWGSLVILLAMVVVGVLLGFNTSFRSLVDRAKAAGILKEKLLPVIDDEEEEQTAEFVDEELLQSEEETPTEEEMAADSEEDEKSEEVKINQPKERKQTATITRHRLRKLDIPINILTFSHSKPASGDINANMVKIKKTLENFGIEVAMGEVNVGPTVTQYTLRPAEGVKLSQILTLQNDLALALAAHPLRIEAPIPGKSLVGIEVPNQVVSTVKLREVLEDEVFTKRKSNLQISLGKDVAGSAKMANLGNMPHLLIAGATGSGKSVCINNVILSLMYQNSPDELKFILIDPKRVELSVYNNMPYLLTPVINDIDKTINALRWAVKEMDERYKLLQAAGKRNIAAYNKAVIVNKLPYIVVVIDELADLMQVAAKEVEAAIIRLAQMARAVGIHLVLATQRPSVNVITGLIKANITSRIAFAVASSMDSRTIIDAAGAEKLLGKGDMLFMTAELSKPRRIQGAYVSDEEIQGVADFVKGKAEPEYKDEIVEKTGSALVGGGFSGGDSFDDDLAMEAKEIVIKAGKASATLLQRRLRVGYARAARLLDILEEMGVVGPAEGAKPREVLITQDDLEENFSSSLDEEEVEEVLDDENFSEEAEETYQEEAEQPEEDNKEEMDKNEKPYFTDEEDK